MKDLTKQQEVFALAVISGVSAAEAYRQAYPKSAGWKDASVNNQAGYLLRQPHVAARVAELQARAAEEAGLVGAEIIREIKRVALSDIGGIMTAEGKVKLPHELDAATRAAVSSFEIDEYGRVKYKFWDKNTALTNAAKIKGLFEIDNKQQAAKAPRMVRLVGLKRSDE